MNIDDGDVNSKRASVSQEMKGKDKAQKSSIAYGQPSESEEATNFTIFKNKSENIREKLEEDKTPAKASKSTKTLGFLPEAIYIGKDLSQNIQPINVIESVESQESKSQATLNETKIRVSLITLKNHFMFSFSYRLLTMKHHPNP